MSMRDEELTVLPERNLDILRAFAVLLVVANHLLEQFGLGSGMDVWLGQAGVSAFFVHTSLVLMASLERDGAPNRPSWVGRFYLRRGFRIYPLAWAAIGFVALFHIPANLTGARTPVDVSQLVANLLLVQDLALKEPLITVLWTLPIEIQMYVLLPLCFLIARRPSRTALLGIAAGACTIAVIARYGMNPAHRIPGLPRLPLVHLIPCFIMGVFAYRILRENRRRQHSALWWPVVMLSGVVLGAYLWTAVPNWMSRTLFCAALGLSLASFRDAPAGLVTRIAHTLAKYSYGIYLLHLLAIRVAFVNYASTTPLVKLFIVAGVMASSCFVAYHAIEQPFIDIGRRLLSERRGVALRTSTTSPS